ncbi:uncharacterized protein [Onthophagus taurus]|uniref:uncharacterized protein n=1 Tax=Onthophagus taurus TaxID=166361 RepID=UPI0039BEC5E3
MVPPLGKEGKRKGSDSGGNVEETRKNKVKELKEKFGETKGKPQQFTYMMASENKARIRSSSCGNLSLNLNPFARSSKLRSSPPATPTIATATEESDDSSLFVDREIGDDMRPIRGNDEQGVVGNEPEEAINAGVEITQMSPKRDYLHKLKRDEEMEIKRCLAIIETMKSATARQRNISMDVKKGLGELEEALEVIAMCKEAQRKVEKEIDERSMKAAAHIQTNSTVKKRGATSPAVGNEKRRRETGSVEKPVVEGDQQQTPNQWIEVVRNNKRKKKKKDTTDDQTAKAAAMVRGKMNVPGPENPGQPNKAAKPRQRSSAVLIKPAEGTTYADVLQKLRNNTNLQEADTTINLIRQTKAGHVLVQFGRNAQNKEAFNKKICEVLGEQARVSSLEPRTSLELLDLDSMTTAEEVEEAIKKEIPALQAETKIRITAENSQMLRKAIVQLSVRDADALVKTGRLRVGWVNSRVRRYAEVLRCYRCLGFGHNQSQCDGPDRRTDQICFNCGEKGHVKAECKNKPKCFLCNGTDRPADHVSGSGGCANFKKALEAAKRAIKPSSR